jgi:bifunctional non-homologous end joining protein LigD
MWRPDTLVTRAPAETAAGLHTADALTSGPVPAGAEWSFEVKWDGCRAQLRYDCRAVSLRTRTGRECSDDSRALAAIKEVLGKRRVTLDGELVCLHDDGRPGFLPLRRRLAGSAGDRLPVVLQVFDVLHLDGWSTRGCPYREQRALLDELALEGPAWRVPASVVVQRAEDIVARVAELGLEGVVAKRLDSTYRPGRRSSSWVQHKLRREERLAVTGVRRSRERNTEAVFVGRRLPDGSVRRAGRDRAGASLRDPRSPRAAARGSAHPSPWRSRLVSSRSVRGRLSARPPRRSRAPHDLRGVDS